MRYQDFSCSTLVDYYFVLNRNFAEKLFIFVDADEGEMNYGKNTQ